MSKSVIHLNRKILFSWEIQMTEFQPKCNVCTLVLNSEWKMKCAIPWPGKVFSNNIEICRQPAVTEASVTVNFTVFTSNVLHRRKTNSFVFEPNSESKMINLDCPIFNSLRISGDVIILGASEYQSRKSSVSTYHFKFLKELSDDFARVLDKKTPFLADVQIKCGSTIIPVHKQILCTRSPVFDSMFSNEMKETYDNEVHITDMDAPVLLTYMYTGHAGNLCYDLARDLLFAANKHELEGLKIVTIDYLKSNISVENVLQLLMLGDLHAEDLKKFALIFIRKKCAFSVLENTKDWKTLIQERSALAVEALTFLVKSHEKKRTSYIRKRMQKNA